MDAEFADETLTESIRWYDRDAVESFLTAAAKRKTVLEQAIAEANERVARAEAAMGIHQMMASMLLETHRELVQIQQDAEAEAAAILLAAEDARRLVSVPAEPAVGESTNGDGSGEPDHLVIDLVAAAAGPEETDLAGGAESEHAAYALAHSSLVEGAGDGPADEESEWIAFLRGSFDDPSPLGPRSE